MTIENTIRQLESHGIEVPERVEAALGIIRAAQSTRAGFRDAASELAAAFRAGTLTEDNFGVKLRDALVDQMTSRTGPNSAMAWEVTRAVENVADMTVRQWLAIEWESILDHFSDQLDAAAAKLTEALPRALPPGAQPEEVLKLGKRGIEAAKEVAEAESELSSVVAYLRSVAAEIEGEELPLSRFISGADGVPLPVESGVWADYVRADFKIGLVSPERAAQSEAVAAQLAYDAEHDEWCERIKQEFSRMSDVRERGLRPAFVTEIPPAHESLVEEVGALFNFTPAQYNRKNVVVY